MQNEKDAKNGQCPDQVTDRQFIWHTGQCRADGREHDDVADSTVEYGIFSIGDIEETGDCEKINIEQPGKLQPVTDIVVDHDNHHQKENVKMIAAIGPCIVKRIGEHGRKGSPHQWIHAEQPVSGEGGKCHTAHKDKAVFYVKIVEHEFFSRLPIFFNQ